ncbi:hypothetical protein Dimus_019440 [Dionaea muscipula]
MRKDPIKVIELSFSNEDDAREGESVATGEEPMALADEPATSVGKPTMDVDDTATLVDAVTESIIADVDDHMDARLAPVPEFMDADVDVASDFSREFVFSSNSDSESVTR